jgi:hypothetical protein
MACRREKNAPAFAMTFPVENAQPVVSPSQIDQSPLRGQCPNCAGFPFNRDFPLGFEMMTRLLFERIF